LAITVREALKLKGLQNARLIAGNAGIDYRIDCVDILEVPDPTGWLRQGEFLVTTCYAMKDNLEAQLHLIREMHHSKGAALAIKFDRFIGGVPERMRQLADELQVPLIDIPLETPFMDITHPLMTAILDEQTRRLTYSIEVHRQLTQVALEANDLQTVAGALFSLIGLETVICNGFFQVLADADRGAVAAKYQIPPEQLVQARANRKKSAVYIWDKGVRRKFALFPVYVRDRCYGYILIDARDMLTEEQLIAIEHAVTITALQMVKDELVAEVRQSYKRDLVEDLISGDIRHRELALSRAEMANIHLDEPVIIIIADIDDFTGYLLQQTQDHESRGAQVKKALYQIINIEFTEYTRHSLIIQRSDSVIVIIPAKIRNNGDNSPQAIRMALLPFIQNIQRKITETALGISATFGISATVKDPTDFSARYHEVRGIIRMTRKTQGPSRIVFWEDAEIFMMLGQLGQTLERFYQTTLGALDNEMVKNRQELLKTLTVYLECGGNSVETAAKLFIHRNTLRYRIQRLEQILGRNLASMEERFSLWLALKARCILKDQKITKLG
jgi:purine catabolism regulator